MPHLFQLCFFVFFHKQSKIQMYGCCVTSTWLSNNLSCTISTFYRANGKNAKKNTHFSFSFEVFSSWKQNLGDVSYEYKSILYRLYNDCCFHTLITAFAQLFSIKWIQVQLLTRSQSSLLSYNLPALLYAIIMCLCAEENNL